MAQGLQFKGTQDQGRGPACPRQDRLLGHASDDRALQVPEVGGQGHAQDDHPVADGAALSRRPAGDRQVGLSRHGAVLRRSRKAYAKAVRAFGEAGCTYLQLDEVFVAYLCDEAQRDYLRGRGDDPDKLLHVYADLVNAACAGRTPGMTISMHLCRGNFRSTWMAQGGYERVADILFNKMGVDAYFMEYDTERAGGFEPLRLPAQEQAGRAGRHDVEDRRAGEQGPAQAPHRRGRQVRAARPALPLAAMRLRQHRGGQPAGRGRAVGQARPLRRGGARGVGLQANPTVPRAAGSPRPGPCSIRESDAPICAPCSSATLPTTTATTRSHL